MTNLWLANPFGPITRTYNRLPDDQDDGFETMNNLHALMARWTELEPDRCNNPFVLVLSEAENMKCVDEYCDGTINATWDEICIEHAVRSAVEARQWDYNLEAGHNEAGDVRYVATVFCHSNPVTSLRQGRTTERPCETLLAAYLEALEDSLGTA